MAIKFSKEQVIDRIRFENPWWETKAIDSFYGSMKRREYFKLFFPLVNESSVKRAIVLMGPRRVGKTVILYHTIDKLLEDGINPLHICYCSIETPLFNGMGLEELLKLFIELQGLSHTQDLYIFFDEIQYLKDWEVHLKSLVDSYHNIKFIVSGSAAAALKLKSRESGAGRFTEFALPPLTFHEFLSLTGSENLIKKDLSESRFQDTSRDIKKLNEKFIEYINYGGYPELSLSKVMQSDPGRYIRNDIIDKVLLRDIPSLYGISDIQELNSLFTYLAYNSGGEMSLDGISQTAGVAKNTIKKYITYLEAAFLIKVVHRIDHNAKKFKRANFFKIYLTNSALRSALFSPISASDSYFGNMVETAIFSQWQHNERPLYYARWKGGEVDIVNLDLVEGPLWCVEIKWSNRYVQKPNELKSVYSFSKKHNLTATIITTINITKKVKYNETLLEFVPASIYCYTVGKNIVLDKRFKKYS